MSSRHESGQTSWNLSLYSVLLPRVNASCDSNFFCFHSPVGQHLCDDPQFDFSIIDSASWNQWTSFTQDNKTWEGSSHQHVPNKLWWNANFEVTRPFVLIFTYLRRSLIDLQHLDETSWKDGQDGNHFFVEDHGCEPLQDTYPSSWQPKKSLTLVLLLFPFTTKTGPVR